MFHVEQCMLGVEPGRMAERCFTWNSICVRSGFFSGNGNIVVVDIMLPIGLAELRLSLIYDAYSGHFT